MQRNHRSTCQHPLDHQKAREFQKNNSFGFIDYAKAFDCVDHNKLWQILKEMGIPDHLICLLRNLYAGQEVWNSHLSKSFPQFVVNHSVQSFNVVNEAKVDVFLEFSCFFYDPTNVGNLSLVPLPFLKPA